MAADLPTLHKKASEHTQTLVAAVRDDQWHLPTPCSEWDVKALVNHMVYENLWAVPLMEGKTIEEVGDQYEGDCVGDDPKGAFDAANAGSIAAMLEAGAMERPINVSYGPVPGTIYCGHRFMDMLIHGWDLATATGQDTTMDPEQVAACWAIVQAEIELLEGSGMFGTRVDLPEGTPVVDRLLASIGRTPG